MTLYELWHSEAESSYSLLYFPDIANYHVRLLDERVVWSTEADSYEDAIQAQYDYLGWGSYRRSPQPFEYPPGKRTFLLIYDYGQGGIWLFVDATDPSAITARYPELAQISQRPSWLTPEHQRRLASTMHFDIDAPSGWLLELEANRQ